MLKWSNPNEDIYIKLIIALQILPINIKSIIKTTNIIIIIILKLIIIIIMII